MNKKEKMADHHSVETSSHFLLWKILGQLIVNEGAGRLDSFEMYWKKLDLHV
jgi:hypothetical protein